MHSTHSKKGISDFVYGFSVCGFLAERSRGGKRLNEVSEFHASNLAPVKAAARGQRTS